MPHQMLAAMFGRRPPPRLEIGLFRNDVRSVHVWVRNVGAGVARSRFVRVRIDRGADNDAFTCNVSPGWDDRGLGSGRAGGWHVRAAMAQGMLYPDEARIVSVLQFLREAPGIEALLQCEDAAPIRIARDRLETRVGETVWISTSD